MIALLLLKVFVPTFVIGLLLFVVGIAIVDYYERNGKHDS